MKDTSRMTREELVEYTKHLKNMIAQLQNELRKALTGKSQ